MLQKEQSCCIDSVHISSPEVVPDSPASPSHPEISSEPYGCNYHHQQTINFSPVITELCIDNLPADEIVKPVLVYDIHSNDLNTVPIMCLNYNANDPSSIDIVNDSGMLVCRNFPAYLGRISWVLYTLQLYWTLDLANGLNYAVQSIFMSGATELCLAE